MGSKGEQRVPRLDSASGNGVVVSSWSGSGTDSRADTDEPAARR